MVSCPTESWMVSNKGAGHFQLSYQGLEFELMGKRGNLTLNSGEMPTLVPFGDTWAPAHAHPGQYLRGRYGPKYLRHAQSWQFVNMANAFDRSSSRYVSTNFSLYESTNFFYQILCNICFDFLKCSKLRRKCLSWPKMNFFSFSTEKYWWKNWSICTRKIRENMSWAQ